MISAVILTKNEQKNIARCIESVGWCDEIIVIDDYSWDKTIEKLFHLRGVPQAQHHLGGGISIKNKLKIYKRHLNGDFAGQRNFALEKATGDWILYIDADEIVSLQFAEEITHLITDNDRYKQLNGFYIKRNDFIFGKWLRYGETANVRLLRIARKGRGRWEGRVHEEWKVEGTIEELKNPILHYPHQTVAEFLKDINWYTDLVAQYWKEQGRKISFWEILIYPKGKFIQNYLLKLGFLDGLPGFIMAIFMSFHSFLARGKYWLVTHK